VPGARTIAVQLLTERFERKNITFAEVFTGLAGRSARPGLAAGGPAETCGESEPSHPKDALPPAADSAEREPQGDPHREAPLVEPAADLRSFGPRVPPADARAAPPLVGAPPPSFAEVWGRLVRRFAWGGDGRRTTARIEIGDGAWSGATIVVTAAAREVAVHVEVPTGLAAGAWCERLIERLRERGLELSELTIRECG
jgi:hypothetical protein